METYDILNPKTTKALECAEWFAAKIFKEKLGTSLFDNSIYAIVKEIEKKAAVNPRKGVNMILTGTIVELLQQWKYIIAYYGNNASIKEIIENENKQA